jgi:hypothetical protein
VAQAGSALTPLPNPVIPNPVTPTPLLTGLVQGTLTSGSGFNVNPVFSFNVDLSSGVISNAAMSASNAGLDSFGVNGGTGTMTPGTWIVSGFSGAAISAGTFTFPIIPSDPTTMTGTGDASYVGAPVSGSYTIDATSSSWSGVDSGTFSGSRTQ